MHLSDLLKKPFCFARCSWEGTECLTIPGFVKESLFDMGSCLAFNAMNDSVRATQAGKDFGYQFAKVPRVFSGKDHGLKLLVNVEHFQQPPGIKQDNGLSVHKFCVIAALL
jgi:hypothetical protein